MYFVFGVLLLSLHNWITLHRFLMKLLLDFVAVVAYTTNKMSHIVLKSDGRHGIANRQRLAPFPTGHGGGAKWWWWSLVKVVIGRVSWSTLQLESKSGYYLGDGGTQA